MSSPRISLVVRAYRVCALAMCMGLAMPWHAVADTPPAPHRHAEAVPNAATTVIVGGEVAKPLVLDAAALAKMDRRSVRASAHGVEGEWGGVALIDVLRAAGAPVDDALRGPNLALYVRVSAADGYRVVYALAELDPKFRDDGVFLVDSKDGKPLSAEEGPFRLVAPAEKRPGRWVRQVIRIDVLKAAD